MTKYRIVKHHADDVRYHIELQSVAMPWRRVFRAHTYWGARFYIWQRQRWERLRDRALARGEEVMWQSK